MGSEFRKSPFFMLFLAAAFLGSLGLAAAAPSNREQATDPGGTTSLRCGQQPVGGLSSGLPYREASPLAGKTRILLVYSDGTGPSDFVLDLANYSDVAFIDQFDAGVATPSLSYLSNYDVVMVWSGNPYSDATALGNVLADYLDMGGKLIEARSDWWSASPYRPGGRFASGGYSPFLNNGPEPPATLASLGTYEAGHPLMNGVTTLSGYSRNPVVLAPMAHLVASWSDGDGLAATKGDVVAINNHLTWGGMGPGTGDWTLLLHNAITFLNTPRARVLIAAADSGIVSLPTELLNDPTIASVDLFGAWAATPTLAQLSRYDAVITWPNVAYADPAAMGDVLADYADIGGKVILGGFCWFTNSPAHLDGRTVTDAYSPLVATTGGNHNSLATLGAHTSNPIMWGVTAASSTYRDYTALAPGANLVAQWSDGELFVAEKANMVAVNGYLGDQGMGGLTGDGNKLVRNALKYLVFVTPSFTATGYSGSAPYAVSFTGGATGGQIPYTYAWDFGDGATSIQQSPSHTFAAAGNFLVQLFVTDANNHTAGMGVYVTVSAPLALTGTASSVSGPAPITASFTSAPSGGTPPYTYDWDFGDGTAHGTTQNAGHTYTAAGGYLATVTVTDAEAHAAAKTFSIAVAPGLTASAAVVPAAGNVPFLATFLATAAGGTPPYTYGWSFGDGGSGSGPSVTHTYLTAGSYTATLTVTDSSSPARTATAAVAATATVLPPIVSSMKKGASPFKIVVAGSNLQSGIQVFINGSQWTGVQYVSAAQIKITGGSSLKAIVPKGVPTLFRFLNPDGGETTVNWQY